jgi:hypothetical protein
MKSSFFWAITPCTSLKINRRLGGKLRLHLQSKIISQEGNQDAASSKLCWSHTVRLIGFQAVMLLLQQNRKSKVVHILAYVPRLDIAVRTNGKSGRVSGPFPGSDLISGPADANAIAAILWYMLSVVTFFACLSCKQFS